MIPLNSILMLHVFHMSCVSVFCIPHLENENVWIILKCVISIHSSRAFIALNLFYILSYKVDRIEEFRYLQAMK